MDKVISWWGKGVFVSLCVAIVLLGIGPLNSSLPGIGISAWSVSRTTFFFWLIWKLLIGIRYGRSQLGFQWRAIPLSLLLFFTCVTVSVLPDFRQGGDYRYFFLGAMHYLIVLDLFSNEQRTHGLIVLLALLPGLLVIRGLLYDPAVLSLTHMIRFGYPLDHANTAGYLFSMTVPLAIGVVASESGQLRVVAIISAAVQGVGLALTYSRAAWVGMAAAILSFGVMLRRWREVWIILTMVGMLLTFVKPLQDRLLTLVSPHTDIAINERMEAMDAGLKLGLDHPVLGVGYGRGHLREGLREQEKKTATEIGHIAHTHNMYIELFAQTGLLGLGTFVWLLYQAFYQTISNASRLDGSGRLLMLGMAASWIAFAITGLGDVPFFHHEIRILFFTFLALTHRCNFSPPQAPQSN